MTACYCNDMMHRVGVRVHDDATGMHRQDLPALTFGKPKEYAGTPQTFAAFTSQIVNGDV